MKYGLIADRVGHSFSAEIHRQLFEYEYELKAIAPDTLASFLESKDFCAINVTIPYKEAVIPYLNEISDTARTIGAVNTIVNDGGRLIGYNTDYYGLRYLIEHNGIDLRDKKVLILGSGGTSKTAFTVAKDLGCGTAWRVSRTAKDGCITYEHAASFHKDADIIINTTPCGMFPHIGESAVALSDYPALKGVIDVVYNPLRSRLVCDAAERNIPAVGGLYMLVAQAAFAAEKFVSKSVPKARIDEIYHRMFAQKQNIVLIGMPGCGKSSVGKRLAEQLDMKFVDTDEEIVLREGRSIPEIFESVGENGFREIEQQVIRDLSAYQHTVIATGGGAVLRQENIRLLRENGRLYFIDRSLEQLIPTEDRPLSASREALEQRYRERYDLYRNRCDVHIRSTNGIEETVNDY